MDNKLLNMLGLCRRAGKLSLGFDPAVGSVIKGESGLILMAADISAKSEKEARFKLSEYDIDIIKLESNGADMGAAVGKAVKIAAVCDSSFAKRIRELAVS